MFSTNSAAISAISAVISPFRARVMRYLLWSLPDRAGLPELYIIIPVSSNYN